MPVDHQALEAACRKMLAQEFDDVCWLDLYREVGVILGVPYDPKLLPKEKFLGNCARYYDCMAAGKTEEYRSVEPTAEIVVFVGGPMHGLKEKRVHAAADIVQANPDGTYSWYKWTDQSHIAWDSMGDRLLARKYVFERTLNRDEVSRAMPAALRTGLPVYPEDRKE